MSEPNIIINGRTLTPGEAMTVRVALGNMLTDMQPVDALGTDEHGVFMRRAYIENIAAIHRIMEGIA